MFVFNPLIIKEKRREREREREREKEIVEL